MIKNTLLYYHTKNQYDANLSQINTNQAIAFVEDEGAIYTHGHKFGGSDSGEVLHDLEEIRGDIIDINNSLEEKAKIYKFPVNLIQYSEEYPHQEVSNLELREVFSTNAAGFESVFLNACLIFSVTEKKYQNPKVFAIVSEHIKDNTGIHKFVGIDGNIVIELTFKISGSVYTEGFVTVTYNESGEVDIPDASVTTAKLANGAVTNDKLANEVKTAISSKQDALDDDPETGNICKINGMSLLRPGNIEITPGGVVALSDWTEDDLDDPAYILHKPGIDLAPINNSDNLISSKAVYNAFNGGPFIEKGTGTAENLVEIEIDWLNSEELCNKVGDAYIDEHDVFQVLISVDPRMFVPKDNLVDNYYWSSPYEVNAGDTITIDSDSAVSMMYYEYSKDKTPIYIPVSGSTIPITHDTYTVINDNVYVRIGFSSAGNYSYTITRYKDASLLPNIDLVPTPNSDNLITSGGVYSAINDASGVTTGHVSGEGTLRLGYYWANTTHHLDAGDVITINPKKSSASQTAWATNPKTPQPVASGSFTFKSLEDGTFVIVGFEENDEYDFTIVRKNSPVLNYVTSSTVSYVEELQLSDFLRALGRLNIGAGGPVTLEEGSVSATGAETPTQGYYWSTEPFNLKENDSLEIIPKHLISSLVAFGTMSQNQLVILAEHTNNYIADQDITVIVGFVSDDSYDYILRRNTSDKAYNNIEHSGLGRVLLKKNIVISGSSKKNILTQDAFYKDGTQTPNTNNVFVVQYDFTIEDGSENVELNFSSSNVSGIMTPEKVELDAATAAYNTSPTSGNLERKQKAEDAYESIGSQDYYYWTTYTIPARHCLYLTGRAFFLNDSKNAILATETNRGVIFAPTNESLTVYIGNLEGRHSCIKNTYITIPANCTLEFNGGSLSEGTIVGDYTTINAPVCEIFKNNLFVDGDFNNVVAYPEWFGAKGDGVTDDTLAIQRCIDFTEAIGGGTTQLGPKKYEVSSLTIKTRTNLKGRGLGATILHSSTDFRVNNAVPDDTGIIVYPNNVGISVVSDMTILGTGYHQNGISVISKKDSVSAPLPGQYGIFENRKSLQTLQAYKDTTITNVYVGRCNYGIVCRQNGYRIIIDKCNVKYCIIGIEFSTTDSSINECYIENCQKDGLSVYGGNNKVTNIKSIWNGAADPLNSYGIRIGGSRHSIANCEVQDNYCSGIIVMGNAHILTNVLANGDGIANEASSPDKIAEIRAKDNVDGQGLTEWAVYTVNSCFNNCIATNYIYSPNRGIPKYAIRYDASHPQTLGTDIKIYSKHLMTLCKNPIYPDTPIRNTHTFNIIEENYDNTKGYKLQNEKVKIDIPLKEIIDTFNMGVICEFIPEEVVEREEIFSLFGFYGLYIQPFESDAELVNGGKRLQLFPVMGDRYPSNNSFKMENVDVNKPIRVFMRANYLKTENNVAQIECLTCLWYYTTAANCYAYAFSRNTVPYDLYTEGGVIQGDFRDYKADSLGFRRNVSYLNAHDATENTVYLRKLVATYDTCIPDTVSYPGYPLYNLNPEFAFDYLTLRTDRRNQYSGPTAKRPQYVSTGNFYYDETLNMPVCYIKGGWSPVGVVPIGNVTPSEGGTPVIENTINANDLKPGTIGAYTRGDTYKDTYNYPFGYCYVLTFCIIPNNTDYLMQICVPRSDNSVVSTTIPEDQKVVKYRTKVDGYWSDWYPNVNEPSA